mmetsp:Transcript_4727/g.15610  ORF Transcript_4727/g.15610 Transcript_4727/m.15610 type:complete len:104 (+) Transcript_4727:1223-1534(+)
MHNTSKFNSNISSTHYNNALWLFRHIKKFIRIDTKLSTRYLWFDWSTTSGYRNVISRVYFTVYINSMVIDKFSEAFDELYAIVTQHAIVGLMDTVNVRRTAFY